ncbi:MAG: ABC transporter permease, partial [Gemmatimonadetes bacterium]|nr:ABC transporter permease [Gemmatimonadota bacterium]
YTRVSQELGRIPGAMAVGGIQFLPMTPGGWWSQYRPEGLALGDGDNEPSTAMRVVFGDYFEAMRIPLLRGRGLLPSDGEAEALPTAVVNETFESEAFPDGSAVGRDVFMDDTRVRIVGVVGDVQQSNLTTGSHAEMYVPFGSQPWQSMHMVVRADGDDAETARAAAAAVRSVDRQVSMLGPRPMVDVVGGTIGAQRLVAWLLALFGMVGFGLGAVGVYGVTAQAVAERRREIGIRLALGANASGVASATVLRGMIHVGLGVTVGVVLALAGGQMLDGLLFGVEASDTTTLLAAPVVLVLVAFTALFIPAIRAGRVDPVRTLREE